MRTIATFAALAIAAGIVIPRYTSQVTAGHPAPTLMAARQDAPAPAPSWSDSHSVTLTRNAGGHFQADGRVDGRRLTFMVDTGASTIALTANDAASLGIHPTQSEFTALVRTANGTVRAAPIELDRVEIEGITVRDVAALVMPDGALSDNLLGMSFLGRLHSWQFAGGKLVLEQ
jgi:aspartyl protease family protein